MATTSFTKSFILEKKSARSFINSMTKHYTKKEEKIFNSKFTHLSDTCDIKKVLMKNK